MTDCNVTHQQKSRNETAKETFDDTIDNKWCANNLQHLIINWQWLLLCAWTYVSRNECSSYKNRLK